MSHWLSSKELSLRSGLRSGLRYGLRSSTATEEDELSSGQGEEGEKSYQPGDGDGDGDGVQIPGTHLVISE